MVYPERLADYRLPAMPLRAAMRRFSFCAPQPNHVPTAAWQHGTCYACYYRCLPGAAVLAPLACATCACLHLPTCGAGSSWRIVIAEADGLVVYRVFFRHCWRSGWRNTQPGCSLREQYRVVPGVVAFLVCGWFSCCGCCSIQPRCCVRTCGCGLHCTLHLHTGRCLQYCTCGDIMPSVLW